MRLTFRTVLLSSTLCSAAALAAGDRSAVEFFQAAKVDAARAAGETGSVLVTDPDFKVMASRRDKPGEAEVHALDTDIFIVIDGAATLVVGGHMVAPREVAAGELRGSGIEGGTEYRLEKGAVITIPRNTPHWVRQVEPGFRYYVVKSTARS